MQNSQKMTKTQIMVITYVYAKNSAPRADRGFLNDVQNTNSNYDITMWAGIYYFLMQRGVCFDWNYFLLDYKMQTYWSHGAPCSTRDLIPWMWKYIIYMNDNREPNGHFRSLSATLLALTELYRNASVTDLHQ